MSSNGSNPSSGWSTVSCSRRAPASSRLPMPDFIATVSAPAGAGRAGRAPPAGRRSIAQGWRRRVRAAWYRRSVRAGVAPARIEFATAPDRMPSAGILHIIWRRTAGLSRSRRPPLASPAGQRQLRHRTPRAATSTSCCPTARSPPACADGRRTPGYRLDGRRPSRPRWWATSTLDVRRFPRRSTASSRGLRASGYPLRMEAGDGRVVRIKHETPLLNSRDAERTHTSTSRRESHDKKRKEPLGGAVPRDSVPGRPGPGQPTGPASGRAVRSGFFSDPARTLPCPAISGGR